MTSVVSNTGGSSVFQGCWLRIQTNIPANYSAPQSGWWKIRYNLTNNTGTTQYSPELTAWKVSIVGNPVHLVNTAASPAPTP